MPPARPSSRGRGRARGSKNRQATDTPSASEQSDRLDDSDDDDDDDDTGGQRQRARAARPTDAEEAPAPPEKSIPKDLLTRVLHEFFTKDATRISRDANAAVGKYMDIFVREAIARAAVEKSAGFLEVEDLEKIAPQLLLDL
ncbi:hypothetical protein E4U41_007341 [Claviceps citrina]|nr:hypothetical protein E4U41_007341 [Claviceps citrina]